MKLAAALLCCALIGSVCAVETFILGQGSNDPPWAFATDDGKLTGFGYDVAMGVNDVCVDYQIAVFQTMWENCWSSENGGQLGALVDDGTIDGCLVYTHTVGRRDELADFSEGIVDLSRSAGLLTMLDEAGVPKVNGLDDLSGRTVVDVAGWAPPPEALNFVENKCTSTSFSKDFDIILGAGNDVAMTLLRNGTADVMFVYSDQADNLICKDGIPADYNCSLWEGFGSEYAYVQTGQFGYAIAGLTLAITKKGSGIPEKLNPCLKEFMQSEAYYDICVKYNVVTECVANEFFPDASFQDVNVANVPTDKQKTGCSDGYCKCPLPGTTNSTTEQADSSVEVPDASPEVPDSSIEDEHSSVNDRAASEAPTVNSSVLMAIIISVAAVILASIAGTISSMLT